MSIIIRSCQQRVAEPLTPLSGSVCFMDRYFFSIDASCQYFYLRIERMASGGKVGVVDALPKRHNAFKKAKSTVTCISNALNTFESSVLQGSLSLGVVFNIEGAFDNFQTPKVQEGLRAKGVPQDIIKWYGFNLTTHIVQVFLGKTIGVSLYQMNTSGGYCPCLAGILSLKVFWTCWGVF